MLKEGDQVVLEATLPEPTVNRPPPPTPAEAGAGTGRAEQVAPGGGRSALVITSVAVAALGAGTGVAYSLAARSARKRRKDAARAIEVQAGNSNSSCREPTSEVAGPCKKLRRSIEDANQAKGRAALGYLVGGVGATLAAATYLLWPESPVQAGLAISPAGVALSVRGSL
jgi:hypothetical protein